MDNFKIDKTWFLRNLDIYEGIPETTLCKIASNAYETNYSKSTQIYNPHEKDGNIYVIKRGEIILYHSNNGKRAIFDTLGPGTVFGSFDPNNTTPTHFAETTKRTLLCITPINEFLEIVKQHPEIMLKFMQNMTNRVQDYENKIKSSIETATEKIYLELERLQKKKQRSFLGKFIDIPLQITHEKLAEYTNLNRVTVTRGLQKLKNEGLISIDKKGIINL